MDIYCLLSEFFNTEVEMYIPVRKYFQYPVTTFIM